MILIQCISKRCSFCNTIIHCYCDQIRNFNISVFLNNLIFIMGFIKITDDANGVFYFSPSIRTNFYAVYKFLLSICFISRRIIAICNHNFVIKIVLKFISGTKEIFLCNSRIASALHINIKISNIIDVNYCAI